MTNTNLLQAMGRIDPKLIADAAPDVQQKKNANKTWVKWASLAACLAIVICAIPLFNLLFYSGDIESPIPIEFELSALTWNRRDTAFSRTSYISPITKDCKEEKINGNDFEKLFNLSNYNKIVPNNSTHYLVTKNNKLYSAKSILQFQEGKVTIIVDPTCYPEFLFTEDSEVQNINGYLIASHQSNFIGDSYEIDIGIKNNGSGIWIIGNSETQEYIEKILNIFLTSEISFSN